MKFNSFEEIDTACCKYLLARTPMDSKHAVELIKAIVGYCCDDRLEREARELLGSLMTRERDYQTLDFDDRKNLVRITVTRLWWEAAERCVGR